MNKIYQNIASGAVCILMVFTLSCRKDAKLISETKPEPGLALPIEKIEATVVKNIDITARKNLSLILRSKEYRFSLNDSEITAMPIKEPYLLPYINNTDGTIRQIEKDEPLFIQLISQGYLTQNTQLKDGPPPSPAVKNQDTLEDLIYADMLIGKFSGLPSKNLSNINLTHANNLLDFKVTDVPNGTTISMMILSRADQYLPLKIQDNQYQAIITGDWFSTADISVKIKADDKAYIIKVLDGKDIKQDRHYKFTIKYSSNNHSFSVITNAESKWSDEVWPN